MSAVWQWGKCSVSSNFFKSSFPSPHFPFLVPRVTSTSCMWRIARAVWRASNSCRLRQAGAARFVCLASRAKTPDTKSWGDVKKSMCAVTTHGRRIPGSKAGRRKFKQPIHWTTTLLNVYTQPNSAAGLRDSYVHLFILATASKVWLTKMRYYIYIYIFFIGVNGVDVLLKCARRQWPKKWSEWLWNAKLF